MTRRPVTAEDVYRWLMQGGTRGSCEAFDAHAVACTLALAMTEGGGDGRSLVDNLGLGTAELQDLVAHTFPHASPVFSRLAPDLAPTFADDELCLRDLLGRSTSADGPLEAHLAAIVARRAQRPNHLWQDLGLRNRRELSWLMERHFEPLAARNRADMKWKKFLYRTICRDGAFLLCTAPSCGECVDFEGCFGDESGESLLAIARRASAR